MNAIFEIINLNERVTVIVSNKKVEKGTIVLDPIHHVNKIKQVCKDNTVVFEDDNGTFIRSAKKIESIIIDNIKINL